MERKLCLVVCSYFFPEVQKIIKSGNYNSVVIKVYHTSCTSGSLTKEKINDIISKLSDEYSKVVFIGSSCIIGENVISDAENKIEFIQLNQCFNLIINESILEHFTNKGYYIVSNGWLKNYKNHINDWGFDQTSAKHFFAESMNKVLLLDTGLDNDYLPQLEAISEYMGLDYEIFPIGLSYCKLLLDSIINQWNVEKERNSLNEKLASAFSRAANFVLAFDQLNNLIDLVEEKDIVSKIFDFLNILFLPKNIIYTAKNTELENDPIFYKDEKLGKDNFSNANFCIELKNQKRTVGVFEVKGIALPQYITKYEEIAQIIGSFGGLAISNARKFNTIFEDEKKIRQYSEQLKELVDTKDKFFSIIAHDLRSPFQGFIGLTEIMADNEYGLKPEELIKYSKEINHSANNLFKMLTNLLEWARLQMGMETLNPSEIDIGELINENINIVVKQSKQKGIKLEVEVISNQYVFADEGMVNSILRNLLTNALKFTRKNGVVTVKTTITESAFLQISISDTGIGMGKDIVDRLFKVGEKIGRDGTNGEQSTGLGLLLCKEFVEKNNGRIWVESEENAGSIFYFTLPLSEKSGIN
jgi:signal transduction histidine kinase